MPVTRTVEAIVNARWTEAVSNVGRVPLYEKGFSVGTMDLRFGVKSVGIFCRGEGKRECVTILARTFLVVLM